MSSSTVQRPGKKLTSYIRIKLFSLLLGCLCVFALYYAYIVLFATADTIPLIIDPTISAANSAQFEVDTSKALERVQNLVNAIDLETKNMRDAADTAWAGKAGVQLDESQVVDNISRLMKEATAVEALLALVQLDATRYQMEYPARLVTLCNTLAAKSKALEDETVKMGERRQRQEEAQMKAQVEARARVTRAEEETKRRAATAATVEPIVKQAVSAKPPPVSAPLPPITSLVQLNIGTNLRGGLTTNPVASQRQQMEGEAGVGVGVSVEAARSAAVSTALLIVCANRPEYLERTLEKVLKYHPRVGFSVIISEDGASDRVKSVIDQFRERMNASPSSLSDATGGVSSSKLYASTVDNKPQTAAIGIKVPVIHLHHPHYHEPAENGYFKLSKHFKYALTTVFDPLHTAYNPFKVGGLIPSAKEGGFQRVVILEEDIDIAPDFFEFFSAVTPIVDKDPTILCASAWNDNGFKHLLPAQISETSPNLVRSDFFPGLGWMMTRAVWTELEPKWPRAYWDDWLREPNNRRGRHTIRPEVCRTYHFGTKGTSFGQYNSFLNSIELNKEFVPFTALDLSYLSEQQWDKDYLSAVRSATVVTMEQFNSITQSATAGDSEFRVIYTSLDGREGTSFPRVAAWAKCMDNIKANVPRTAYHGVVSVFKEGHKVHLVPKDFQ